MAKRFGDKLKQHREELGVSLSQLCADTGIDKKSLGDFESNLRAPTKILAEKLAGSIPLKLSYSVLKDWRAMDRASLCIYMPELFNECDWPHASDFR
jgi:transcriptional regulator with XRE-family HTH domain